VKQGAMFMQESAHSCHNSPLLVSPNNNDTIKIRIVINSSGGFLHPAVMLQRLALITT